LHDDLAEVDLPTLEEPEHPRLRRLNTLRWLSGAL